MTTKISSIERYKKSKNQNLESLFDNAEETIIYELSFINDPDEIQSKTRKIIDEYEEDMHKMQNQHMLLVRHI